MPCPGLLGRRARTAGPWAGRRPGQGRVGAAAAYCCQSSTGRGQKSARSLAARPPPSQSCEVLWNPFDDIVPRTTAAEKAAEQQHKCAGLCPSCFFCVSRCASVVGLCLLACTCAFATVWLAHMQLISSHGHPSPAPAPRAPCRAPPGPNPHPVTPPRAAADPRRAAEAARVEKKGRKRNLTLLSFGDDAEAEEAQLAAARWGRGRSVHDPHGRFSVANQGACCAVPFRAAQHCGRAAPRVARGTSQDRRPSLPRPP